MTYKILVVDDEADIVKLLQSFLEKRQYEVLTAYSGAEALRQAEKAPDLILLDINMPDLDGLSVCEQLRHHLSCPIVFLTARIEEADRVAGFGAGGDDYIVKPFSLAELEARIAAHLRREERHAGSAKYAFKMAWSSIMPRTVSLIRISRSVWPKKNLPSWRFCHAMAGRSLIRSVFTRAFGDGTAQATAP